MFKKYVLKCLCVLSLVSVFISCQIGLGESVDTDAPNGEITSPGVNAIIRDAFAIKGEWKDDGKVTQVKINLRNTDTRQTANYDASVKSNGTWMCAIDPESENQPLVDGKYLATITLIDDVGHSSVLTRSYTIDNTPPVVVLSYLKDARDNVNEIKTYGHKLYLSGRAADDSNIDKIDVKVYGDKRCSDADELATITKVNVPLAIEQDIAEFGTEDYTHIYGSAENSMEKVQRWCKIWAYDGAQRYPADGSAQSAADKLGNCQRSYYLQKSLELTSVNGQTLDTYKINDLYAMFNGTYSSSNNSRDGMNPGAVTDVLKGLKGLEIDVGTFQISPKNNPTFSVSGLPKTDSDEPFQVLNGDKNSGTSLQITVAPGSDGYEIKTETVEYYLQECDEKGNVKDGAAKIILGSGSSVCDTKPISTVNYILETGRYYRVYASGKDTKDNDIDSNYTEDGKEITYVFYLSPNTGNIDIYSLEVSPDYVTTEEAGKPENKELKVTITYTYKNSDLHVLRAFDDEELKQLDVKIPCGEDKKVSWTDTIPFESWKNHKTIKYQLQNSNENNVGVYTSSVRDFEINIDNEKPEVAKDSIKLPGAKDTSSYLFSFAGKVKDKASGVSEVKITLSNTEEGSEALEFTATGTSDWTYQVSRDDIENGVYGDIFKTEGEKFITVQATDNVGLQSEAVTFKWIYKASTPDFKLFAYQPEDEGDKAKSVDLFASESSFAIGKKFTLKGTAEDKFGIKAIKVVQKNEKDGEEKTFTLSSESENEIDYDEQTGSWTVSQLPLGGIQKEETVKYTYTFTVTDKADLTYTTKALAVTVDDSETVKPEITSPSLAFGEESLHGTDYTFKGSYTDKVIGIQTIKYAIGKAGESSELVWKDVDKAEGEKWSVSNKSDADSLADGKYILYVKAVDNANKESQAASREFCVDQNKPSLKVEVFKDSSEEDLSAENNSYKIKNDGKVNNFVLKVTAADANGIKAVNLKNGDEVIALSHENGSDSWTTSAFDTENTYNFSIEVEDGSGSEISESESISGKIVKDSVAVIFDKTAPQISVTNADKALMQRKRPGIQEAEQLIFPVNLEIQVLESELEQSVWMVVQKQNCRHLTTGHTDYLLEAWKKMMKVQKAIIQFL